MERTLGAGTGTMIIVLVLIAVGALLGYTFASRVRRRQLRRTLGAYPAAFLRNGRWESGIMHFTDEALLWYRDRSVSPVPVVCVPRHLLSMRRMDQSSSAAETLARSPLGQRNPSWIAVELSTEADDACAPLAGRTCTALSGPLSLIPARAKAGESFVFALGYEQSAGITSWLEAWGSVGRGQWR